MANVFPRCPNVPKTHGNFGTQICMPGGNYLAANSAAETAIRNAVAFWSAANRRRETFRSHGFDFGWANFRLLCGMQ